MKKLTQVEVLDDYKLGLTFQDGMRGTVDLNSLAGRGVFSAWDDYNEFRSVEVGESGDLRWSCGVDLCPDALYLQVSGKTVEELFPEPAPAAPHA